MTHTIGQAPPGWSTMPPDAALCESLAAADLNASERQAIDLYAKRLAERGTLPKNARDKLIALAQAKGILAAKPKGKEPAGPVSAPGDYSTARGTPGARFAAALLEKYREIPKPPPLPRRRGTEE